MIFTAHTINGLSTNFSSGYCCLWCKTQHREIDSEILSEEHEWRQNKDYLKAMSIIKKRGQKVAVVQEDGNVDMESLDDDEDDGDLSEEGEEIQFVEVEDAGSDNEEEDEQEGEKDVEIDEEKEDEKDILKGRVAHLFFLMS